VWKRTHTAAEGPPQLCPDVETPHVSPAFIQRDEDRPLSCTVHEHPPMASAFPRIAHPGARPAAAPPADGPARAGSPPFADSPLPGRPSRRFTSYSCPPSYPALMLDRTVLLVSPNPARLCAWEALVARADALSLPAPSLADARALLRHLRPDLLVLDAAFPPAEARTLLRALRTHPRLARVPLLLVWPSEAAALAAGAHDALVPDTHTRVWHGPAPLPIRALLAAPLAPDTPSRPVPTRPRQGAPCHHGARRTAHGAVSGRPPHPVCARAPVLPPL